jgi:hypothetical protein
MKGSSSYYDVSKSDVAIAVIVYEYTSDIQLINTIR